MMKKSLLVSGLLFLTALLLFGCSSTDSNDDSQTGDDDDSESEWCETAGNCGTFVDSRDSTTYKWTKIGDQVWMAENLNFGTPIVGTANQKNATATDAEKYCYNDDELSCTIYGGLYQWHSAMALLFSCNSSSNCVVNFPHRGICPEGWHIPTNAEWATLTSWVDEDNDGVVNDNEAISLKSTNRWSNRNGTDSYGWAGLPGGDRFGGGFSDQNNFGYWWSASEIDKGLAWASYAWAWVLTFGYSNELFDDQYFKDDIGNSVRCVKD